MTTSSTDTFVGTAKNDTFTATSATLQADDRIADVSTTDNDVMNVTLTANPVKMDVKNVENINLDWDAYGTPTIDLDNVSGATVTLSSDKQGYLGNAAITNVDRNNITLGDGIVGTVTVDGTVDSTINAGSAKTLTITGADRDLTVNANNSTTVTIAIANDVDNLTVSATNATALTVDANRDADVTVGKNAKLTMTGTADYTIQSTADAKLSILNGATYKTLTVAGDNDVTLSFEKTADVVGKEIINAGTIILEEKLSALADFTDIEAESIVLDAAQDAATTITTLTDANFTLNKASTAAVTFETDTTKTSSDTITVTTKGATDAGLVFAAAATPEVDFETATIISDAKVIKNAADVVYTVITSLTNKVVLQSEVNDIEITNITAKEVDASGVAGGLKIATAGTATTDMIVIGSKGKNDVSFAATGNNSTFIGSTTTDTDDTVTFATTVGEAVAIVNGGTNVVSATGVIAGKGQLTVVAGSGDDKVTANTATTGTLSINLGNGKNLLNANGLTTGTLEYTGGAGVDTVNVGATTGIGGAKTAVTLNLGAGNNVANVTYLGGAGKAAEKLQITALGGDDTVSLLAKVGTVATTAADTINIDLGTGTNTLKINSDISVMSDTSSITGVNVIDATTANPQTNIAVNATLLDGATVLVKGSESTDKAATDLLTVKILDKDDANVDFSNVTMSNSVGSDMYGLSIVGHTTANNTIAGSQGNDTITLTAGKGSDTIVFAATAKLNGSDTITKFETGSDKLDFSAMTLVGTGNYATAAAADATKKALSASKVIVVTDISTDAVKAGALLVMNAAINTTGDVTGNTLIAVQTSAGDIDIYSYANDGVNAAIDADEITLVGTLDTYTAATLVSADFIVA